LDYGIAALQKPKSEKKKKKFCTIIFHLHFFSRLVICVANKKMFSVGHMVRAYKSAIPHGRLKCSAVLLLET
jgi:hypothetical protein